MNIIRLYETLALDSASLRTISENDIIRVEKQINIAKRLDASIDANVAAYLIEALRRYPEAFYILTQQPELYNLWAGTSYPNSHFTAVETPTDFEAIQALIQAYLLDDLALAIEQKMAENKFEDLLKLMAYHAFFPEELQQRILRKCTQKIDFAISQFQNSRTDTARIAYIKTSSFYRFLNFFTTPELDDKIQTLLNIVVDAFNNKTHSSADTVMVAMASYKPFDEELEETLLNNRDVVFGNPNTTSQSTSGFNWRVFFVIVFILLKIAVVSNRCDRDSNVPPIELEGLTVDSSGVKLDRYYTQMRFKIDSFQVFLTQFDPSKITQVKPKDRLVTGSNPFTTFYNDQVSSSGNERFQRIKNKSNYDVIVLENVIVYDSIKMPAKAYYIKAKESFELNTSDYNKRILNFYVGRNLASFQDPSRHYFIGNHSEVEFRFSILAPNAKALIKEDCRFEGPIVIREEKGQVEVITQESNATLEEIKDAATIK